MATGGVAIAWTPDMDAALRDGLARDFSLVRIAEEIGVAQGTAAKRADALGLSRRRVRGFGSDFVRRSGLSAEMAFAECLAEGASVDEAAAKCGYAYGNSVLQTIRRKLGPQAQ